MMAIILKYLSYYICWIMKFVDNTNIIIKKIAVLPSLRIQYTNGDKWFIIPNEWQRMYQDSTIIPLTQQEKKTTTTFSQKLHVNI